MNYIVRKVNKYGNKKIEYEGLKYDSKGEAGLASEINLLIKAKQLKAVERQVTFPLYAKNGTKICNHRVDFVVTLPDGEKQAWEYKGFATQEWKFKRDMFVDNYPEIEYHVFTARDKYVALKKKRK